jgi:hypothetical protein
MGCLLLALLAVSGALPTTGSSWSREPSRPNVVFIAIDDINDWTGFRQGNPQAITPNLDRLAERSVKITNPIALR